MELDELNKQMLLLQNEFKMQPPQPQPPQQYKELINTINFCPPSDSAINTIQIKKLIKSNGNRNDINDKLNNINMTLPMNENNNTFQSMPQFSRTSNYMQLEQPDNLYKKHTDYANGCNSSGNSGNSGNNGNNDQDTMFINKVNNTGFNKVDKRIDYRQNINNKIDNFTFDNPNATRFNPVLQNNGYCLQRDTRMVIQDSSKDYYRQESNSRLSEYSPLSRASNIPINIANMSVNDFYGGLQADDPSSKFNEDNKSLLNSRIDQYAPLAKTTQYQTQNGNTQQPQSYPQSSYMQQFHKPKQWNPNDVNLKTNNVVYNDLPVMSNKII